MMGGGTQDTLTSLSALPLLKCSNSPLTHSQKCLFTQASPLSPDTQIHPSPAMSHVHKAYSRAALSSNNPTQNSCMQRLDQAKARLRSSQRHSLHLHLTASCTWQQAAQSSSLWNTDGHSKPATVKVCPSKCPCSSFGRQQGTQPHTDHVPGTLELQIVQTTTAAKSFQVSITGTWPTNCKCTSHH